MSFASLAALRDVSCASYHVSAASRFGPDLCQPIGLLVIIIRRLMAPTIPACGGSV